MIRTDIKGVFLLVLLALISAFAFNHFSPFGIALFGQWEPSKGVVSAISNIDPVVDNSIEINDPGIVKQMVQKKERIILDVRPREIYNQGHIPSALSFPLDALDSNPDEMLGSIDRASAILVYCSSVECSDSHTFARHLNNLKYTDVKVFSGGFRQWQEKGFKIEKNED